MKFNVKLVKDYLLKHGVVYTVRGYSTVSKFGVVDLDGIDYIREKIRKVDSPADIVDYTAMSGFDSVEEWWLRIEGFGAVGGTLYKVELLEAAEVQSPHIFKDEPLLTLKQAEFNNEVDSVYFNNGTIPKDATVEVVRCPYETLIKASEEDVKLCPHAGTCKKKQNASNCTVPHIHNFFSPGDHIAHAEMTVAKGYSLDAVLARIARKRAQLQAWCAGGKVIVKPRKMPVKAKETAWKPTAGLKTKAETYSVYEFNTAPPEHEKFVPDMTAKERWGVADRRESKRLEYIQLCRDVKIDAMLGC